MIDITTYAVCGNLITYRAYTNTDKEPNIDEWKQLIKWFRKNDTF